MHTSRMLWLGLAAIVAMTAGCVQRKLTIHSEPAGALVWLNDKEVGRTPLTIPFEWYGDYDVIIRQPGCETYKGHRKLSPPWYQIPPVDIVAEAMWPATIYDERTWHFKLEPAQPADEAKLIERAAHARENAAAHKVDATTQPAAAPANDAKTDTAQKK